MTKKELLMRELSEVPEPLLEELLDFIRRLKSRRGPERLETALASESSLAKDWLKPEEDEAWRDL